MNYKIIYTERKSVALKITNGALVVRAPRGTPQSEIERIIKKHNEWINKKLKISAENSARFPTLNEQALTQIKKEAKEYFYSKCKEYAEIMGLKYGRITITSAKTRFGSCSSEKNISFSYRLMFYPEAAREYVIVHELSHLVFMNHSKKFYELISRYLPDYKERKRLLSQ